MVSFNHTLRLPVLVAGRPGRGGQLESRVGGRPTDEQTRRDLGMLARFVHVYCTNKHPTVLKRPVDLKTPDLVALAGSVPPLCPSCAKLLAHALVKRLNCPMDRKPACKHCPRHCYHPKYRRRIREVMMYSGRKLVLSGRFDYLFHLLF